VHEGKECDLAYHNVLMVLLWSSLASGRVSLMARTLQAMPPVPRTAGWLTYVRCHDDIGWAITEEDAGRVGLDAHLHRRFLADFYAGDFPASFARGARFQPDPRSGEARTSGSTASLAGLESADGDQLATELAIRRILLVHAVAFAHGGLPLLYMGDELGLVNDAGWAEDPAHAADNRWMHRPRMDWDAAAERHDAASVPGRIWAGLTRLIAARRATRAVHAQGRTLPLDTGSDHVFALLREFAGERLLLVANFTATAQSVPARMHGFEVHAGAALADGRPLQAGAGEVALAPYQYLWVTG
jgi:amylosucrase